MLPYEREHGQQLLKFFLLQMQRLFKGGAFLMVAFVLKLDATKNNIVLTTLTVL